MSGKCKKCCSDCVCQKLSKKDKELFEKFKELAWERIFAIKLKECRHKDDTVHIGGWTNVFFGTTYNLEGHVNEALKTYFGEYYKTVRIAPERVGYQKVLVGWTLRLHGSTN